MRKLTMVDFDEAYRLLEKSFIPAELRPYDKMKSFFEKDAFVLYGYEDGGKIAAVLIVWEFEHFVYLENFAVDQTLRGNGLGSQLLQNFQELYPSKLLIHEVEDPIDELTKRRVGFYSRNGYILNPFHYIQPALRSNASEVHLMLMSYPKTINEYLFDQIKKQLFRVVYGQMV